LEIDEELIAYQPNDESSESESRESTSTPRPSNQRAAAKGYKVGWLGRFGAEKDPHLWVDVFENLNRDFPQVSGVMAGTGPLESETRDLINHQGLNDAIQILGITSGSRKFLDSVDLLLLTSRYDGRPNVVAEAASCSIPVVATSSGDLVFMEEHYQNLMVSKRRDSEVLGGMASMVALAV
jgi:glycosyltransferase involved in cell wall biosynthesis